MFTISVETHFQAPHRLMLPDGSKEPLHHHNWVVGVEVGSNKLNDTGLVMDFRQLKTMVEDVVDKLDNTPLSGIDYFRRNNPSAENVAKYIYEAIEPKLPADVKLQSIRVVEQPGCLAKFGK